MAFMPSPNCMAAASAAAGTGKVTEAEVLAAFSRLDDYRKKLEQGGNLTGRAAAMQRFAAQEAQRTKIAAAMQRRHAALNVLKRKALDAHVDDLLVQGMRPHKVLLALLEGTQRAVRGGRKSVAATVESFQRKYLGKMMAELERERPHLVNTLRDKRLDADIMREMMELRDGGKPGSTGNKDAEFVAKTFAKYAEMARTDLNRRGAAIGKLDGWAGPQTHDDIAMIKAGKDAWVGRVMGLLDLERTFPDGLSSEEGARALGDIYDTIITGISNKPTPAEKGQRVNPANLAKSLGKSRVLHFKDAEAALAYREDFGYSNTFTGMIGHLMRSAKMAGAMEVLGPNPEVMFASMAEDLKQRLKSSPNLSDKEKNKLQNRLDTQAGALRHALDIATGLNSRPVNVTFAKLGTDIRAQQTMAKLGGAAISSVGDTVTAGAASQFRGSGFLKGVTQQWAGILRGRPRGEQAEIAYLIGDGYDGLIGHILNPSAALDGPVGHMARWQEKFFKWNGLTWWTDVNRSVASRVIAAEMGMRLGKGWADLPGRYRHVLETHGFTPEQWGVMGKATLRQSNGKVYLTPDRIAELTDADIEPLARERLKAGAKLKGQAKADFEAGVYQDARDALELQVLRYYADETSSAVIVPDARSRRTSTLGTRPGDWPGEITRLIMQFKGYPIAFTQRVAGRAAFGYSKGERLSQVAHIGTLMAGLTMAGYAAMTAKDVLKGYWPPRDPADPRTWLAAAQQGGAWGIYGDFLFSQTNRFGGGFLETAAGPTLGNIGDLVQIGLDARDTAMSGGEDTFGTAKALSVGIGNVPYANLFYLKPALDYLFLNSLREAASPGYMRKQAATRKREYDQVPMQPLGPPRDPLNLARAF